MDVSGKEVMKCIVSMRATSAQAAELKPDCIESPQKALTPNNTARSNHRRQQGNNSNNINSTKSSNTPFGSGNNSHDTKKTTLQQQ